MTPPTQPRWRAWLVAAGEPRWSRVRSRADDGTSFSGDANQVTSKLMRLMPAPDGANQHYLDEIRGVLQAVQANTTIRSVTELRQRLEHPAPHVRDQHDLNLVNTIVDTKTRTTAGGRALQLARRAQAPRTLDRRRRMVLRPAPG